MSTPDGSGVFESVLSVMRGGAVCSDWVVSGRVIFMSLSVPRGEGLEVWVDKGWGYGSSC